MNLVDCTKYYKWKFFARITIDWTEPTEHWTTRSQKRQKPDTAETDHLNPYQDVFSSFLRLNHHHSNHLHSKHLLSIHMVLFS